MSIAVAVTDNDEGWAALEAAFREATQLDVPLVVINLTATDIGKARIPSKLASDIVGPDTHSDRDEVEQVLDAVDSRPAITRLVVGVRPRSPIGKAVLGSIAQRLILEATVPVLAVKTTNHSR